MSVAAEGQRHFNTGQPEEAQRLFNAGQLEEALEAAESGASQTGASAGEPALLAARVELRMGRSEAAAVRLRGLVDRGESSEATRTLLGIALFRTGRKQEGLDLLEAAFRESKDSEKRSEAAYYRAWAAYSDRHLTDADRWVSAALDDADGIIAARALALSAWISVALEQYTASTRSFRLSLKALRTTSERDDGLAALIIANLAAFAAELADTNLAKFVATQTEGTSWPPVSQPQHFHTLLHLAIAATVDGNTGSALDLLDEAYEIAGAHGILRAQAAVEMAEIYRLLDEPTAAARTFRKASQALRTVDWANLRITDQMAFLECACSAARLDPSSSHEWLARYSALPKDDPGWEELARDRRVQALELHARGTVQCAKGDLDQGLPQLSEAFSIWSSLGYVRRACYAAFDIQRYADKVHAKEFSAACDALPNHPLFAQVQTLRPASDLVLTQAEVRVLDALCRASSVRDMARDWGRSEYTIRNHIKRLFSKFGVRSTTALVATAMSTASSRAGDAMCRKQARRER